MLKASIELDRLVCHAEPESSAEPYMWTCFLHGDMNTFFGTEGHRVSTTTPHANRTTRGAFPNGIGAGDTLAIPHSLGTHEVVLDPGPLGLAVVGVLFVLMDQDSTPGCAIRAGHEAFASSVHDVIDAYVDQQFPGIPDPTDADIQDLASQIQATVTSAIKYQLSPFHVFYNHDAVYGFGHLLLSDLADIVVGDVSTSRNFTSRLTGELVIGSARLPFDYEVELHVSCEPADQPSGPCARQCETLRDAVAIVPGLDQEMERTVRGLRNASDDERQVLRRALSELRTRDRPAAVDLLDAAHRDCRRCQGGDVVLGAAAAPSGGCQASTPRRSARSAQALEPALVAVTALASSYR